MTPESWSAKGDLGELRKPTRIPCRVRAVLNACPDVYSGRCSSAIPCRAVEGGSCARRRLPSDDALHGAGAAAALEDAAVLARCLEPAPGSLEQALKLYEATRKPRASAIQANPHQHLDATDADPGWFTAMTPERAAGRIAGACL